MPSHMSKIGEVQVTKLRVWFNALGVLDTEVVFPKVKSLGIDTIRTRSSKAEKKITLRLCSSALDFRDYLRDSFVEREIPDRIAEDVSNDVP